MISIYLNGEDKTSQISDWKMSRGQQGTLTLICHFDSGEKSTFPFNECSITPSQEIQGGLLVKKGSSSFKEIRKAVIYGDKYADIYYPGNEKPYLTNLKNIQWFPKTAIKDDPIFSYFTSVAVARVNNATLGGKPIADNVLRQLDKIVPHEHTALHAYCAGQSKQEEQAGNFIYPFGLNESQLNAVEQAFTSQISMIEGPPGTGKTQTILNILANILLRGKTVAVLSNNNEAVINVYEKLEKSGFDYLVAKLGSKDNRKAFFDALPAKPLQAPAPPPTLQEIQTTLQRLKLNLHLQNAVGRLQAEIEELNIERRYLLQWQSDNHVANPISLDKYSLSPRKVTDLMAYMNHLAENRIRLKDRINLLLEFKIIRTKPFSDQAKRQSAIYALQLHYYDKALLDKKTTLARHQDTLERGNFDTLMNVLTTDSMAHLKYHLHQHIPDDHAFKAEQYRDDFDRFSKRFPILGSSTHSVINSIGKGALLDYVIIDEASQQDIVPGILALGCAKNLIIVGDRKQLPHIPTVLDVTPPSPFYDCAKYSLLDSCVSVFNNSIPMTLLKEHYRCHPKIIQFCNQQFYQNELIPMTQDRGEKALTLIITGKGNHTRSNTNLRELDSLLETLERTGEGAWEGENGRGFIAPYNAQVALSGTQLPDDFISKTVHKFQGRECDQIVFSTVLDKKWTSRKSLGFVDDPHMVNVAVSRAKNSFTLVTGDDVFAARNGHIAALVRYIEYYTDEYQIHRAPVISAFDLLYKEYDQSLERLNGKLRAKDSRFKSEQIMAQILRDALDQDGYRTMNFHSQILLSQLASSDNEALTAGELSFMKNRSTCDFVIYFNVGKTPLGVIEVDGGHHDLPEQAARDALKNSILQKSAIPLLRVRTVESHIEQKVIEFLRQWSTAPQLSGNDRK